jgi:hypothetical protein
VRDGSRPASAAGDALGCLGCGCAALVAAVLFLLLLALVFALLA